MILGGGALGPAPYSKPRASGDDPLAAEISSALMA